MFFLEQSKSEQLKYEALLQILGSLSNLFSDSNVPYLYYRWAERAFCRAFNALDHSRWDTAIDAGKDDIGIGLKTFLAKNDKTFEKVAEFNRESVNFRKISDPTELIMEISRLRNERLDFAKGTHGVNNLVYHCVTRKLWYFYISEEIMHHVNINHINKINPDGNIINFSDWINQYKFNITKSTLFKQFNINPIYGFNINILKDPFEYLENIVWRSEAEWLKNELLWSSEQRVIATVTLPLYSERWSKHVPENSWLNQWNAWWRSRKSREVYIPIPAWIYGTNPWFFPSYETPFELVLPNGKVLSAKVCSGKKETPKALYSNPNTDLGEWMIDEVLKVPEGKIVTYDTLVNVWTDSVEISKLDSNRFAINFKKTWAYDDFRIESLTWISSTLEEEEED